MDYQNLLVEKKDNIAIVTINRPDKLNALNAQTMSELKSAFTELKSDNETFVVIVTGSFRPR